MRPKRKASVLIGPLLASPVGTPQEPLAPVDHRCKDCRYWYGAEDDEYGPCQIKQSRGDRRFVTFGGHACDEPLALAEYGVTKS